MSIVGGLVLGDTAVSAGLVGAPSLMVVALTAIAGYAVPRLYEPLALLRLGFLLAGHFLGVWGVMIGLVLVLHSRALRSSFGVPLLSPISPLDGKLAVRDVLARAPWPRLSKGEALVQDMPGSRGAGPIERRLAHGNHSESQRTPVFSGPVRGPGHRGPGLQRPVRRRPPLPG